MKAVKLFITCILFLAAGPAKSQHNLIYQDWYHIVPGGMMEWTFAEKTFQFQGVDFLFESRSIKQSQVIIDKYTKGNIICFVYKDKDIADSAIFRTAVIRDPQGAGGELDVVMNCMPDDYYDTVDLRKAFYNFDSSNYVIARFFDRKTIEGFQKLKDIQDMPAAERKRIADLYRVARTSFRKRFTEKASWLEESFVLRQELADLLIAAGYNPLVVELDLKKHLLLDL